MAKDAFNKRRELLTKRMSINFKKRVIKIIVWSVALYGSETWMLRKKERDKLEAFEMWMWRNMMKISWQEHKTNEYVLQTVGERRKITGNDNGKKEKVAWTYIERRKSC